MLAQTFAIVIVILAVLGPGIFLWQFARKRGGITAKFAWTVLAAALLLICWLVFFPGSHSTPQERISQFVGAWGILFMAVGLVVVGAEVTKMVKARKRRQSGE